MVRLGQLIVYLPNQIDMAGLFIGLTIPNHQLTYTWSVQLGQFDVLDLMFALFIIQSTISKTSSVHTKFALLSSKIDINCKI